MTRMEFIDMLCKRYNATYMDAPMLIIKYAEDNEFEDDDYNLFNKEVNEDNIVSFY